MSCNGLDMTEGNITTLTRELASARNSASVCYRQFCEMLSHALNSATSLDKWIQETASSTRSSSHNRTSPTAQTTISDKHLKNPQSDLAPVKNITVTDSVYRLRANQSCPSDFFTKQHFQADFDDVRVRSLPEQRVRMLRAKDGPLIRCERGSLQQEGLHNLISALQQCSSLTGA